MEEAKIIIHNLPSDFTPERLLELVESYGDIVEKEFKWGIGFVGFADPNCAEEAFTGLQGKVVGENKLKVDFPGRKIPVSRLIVKNLPTTGFSTADLKALFETYGTINECVYMWGYGFIKFADEKSVTESTKALKGTELQTGRKIYFELQGANGEVKTNDDPIQMAIDDPNSVYSKIGPVRLFLGNLNEGTTEEEVLAVVEPLGEIKKIDVKSNFGFIHFKEPIACRDALSVLAKKVINGANIRVQLAEVKRGGKLYIGGLNEDIDKEELVSAFLQFGSIVEFKFVRKIAFITFDDPADAKKALDMNTKTICGCQLKVAISSSDRAITNGDSEACHSCGQRGHISRYCPADKKDACHKCHESGHWARDCPRTGGAGAIAPPEGDRRMSDRLRVYCINMPKNEWARINYARDEWRREEYRRDELRRNDFHRDEWS